MSDARVKIATVDQIPEGEGRVCEAAGRTLAVFNADGRFYAMDNSCTHRGGPLGEGELDGTTVTCPWHGWRWDVTTGANVNNPDYRQFLKLGEIPQPSQIFVLKGHGRNRQLTDLKRGAQDPTWSPDGRQIAFASSGPHGDIFVMNADGSDIRRVAGTPKRDVAPDWSPDGTRITFNTNQGDLCGLGLIWVASVPDGALTQLTQKKDGGDAAWSPDG